MSTKVFENDKVATLSPSEDYFGGLMRSDLLDIYYLYYLNLNYKL